MGASSNVSRVGVYAFGLMLFSAPLSAAEFGEWDANADARLTSEEFRTNFEEVGVFNTWDENDDLGLSESEFETGLGDDATAFNTRFGDKVFDEWDLNDDNRLSKDEFYNGVYASYDSDGDKIIEEPEVGFWDV